jgi:DNA-binding response OmpR family regulator
MGASLVAGLIDTDAVQADYSAWLGEAGYGVRAYNGAADFRHRVSGETVDFVLLDLVLPDGDGLSLLEWLRHSAYGRLPVIVVTTRSTEDDIVNGLRGGADDYCIKPVRRNELLARIEAVLRRAGLGISDGVLRHAPPYELDTAKRRITIDGAQVKLTDREFDLAAFLFRRLGHVVSRETLLNQVWNVTGAVATRTVDTHVSRLRKKLSLNGAHGWQLTAVYQHGYRLERS